MKELPWISVRVCGLIIRDMITSKISTVSPEVVLGHSRYFLRPPPPTNTSCVKWIIYSLPIGSIEEYKMPLYFGNQSILWVRQLLQRQWQISHDFWYVRYSLDFLNLRSVYGRIPNSTVIVKGKLKRDWQEVFSK